MQRWPEPVLRFSRSVHTLALETPTALTISEKQYIRPSQNEHGIKFSQFTYTLCVVTVASKGEFSWVSGGLWLNFSKMNTFLFFKKVSNVKGLGTVRISE